jgi:hypothetical protein
MDPSVLRNLQNWPTSSYSSRMNLVLHPTGGNVRLGGESVIPRVCMPSIPRRILIGRRIWRGMGHLLWTLTRGLLCRWRVKNHPRFVKVIGMGWELEVTLEEGKGMIQRWMVLLGKKTTDDLHTYECVSHSNQLVLKKKFVKWWWIVWSKHHFHLKKEKKPCCMGVQLTFCVIEGDKIICLGSKYNESYY